MAQILSIYGLVVSVIISGDLSEMMSLHKGFMQLGAGISVGLSGLAAGFAIGIVGDAGGKYLPVSVFLNWWCLMMTVNSASQLSTAASLRWHGADLDLRRSPGTLWGYCVHLDAHQGRRGGSRVPLLSNTFQPLLGIPFCYTKLLMGNKSWIEPSYLKNRRCVSSA